MSNTLFDTYQRTRKALDSIAPEVQRDSAEVQAAHQEAAIALNKLTAACERARLVASIQRAEQRVFELKRELDLYKDDSDEVAAEL